MENLQIAAIPGYLAVALMAALGAGCENQETAPHAAPTAGGMASAGVSASSNAGSPLGLPSGGGGGAGAGVPSQACGTTTAQGGGGGAGAPAEAGKAGQPGDEGRLVDWPNETNTGVPDNVALTASGSLVVTTNGQVIEGLDILGSVVVKADDVIIRNSKITNDATAIRFEEGSNLVVERVTLDGATATTLDGAIQAWGDIEVRRIRVSGFGEGIAVYGAGGLIQDSYFHDMTNAEGDLMDGIEAWEARSLIIRHNWIEMPGGNSVIKLPLDVPVPGGDDVLIENNLIAGGGWAVYGGYDPPNSNPSYTNVRFVGNHFSTMFEPKCGFYGPGAFIESALSHDNVWHETGEALEL